MLIDTHCHIHDPEYDFDAVATLARAHENHVDKSIVIGTSIPNNTVAKEFANAHSEVFWTYGYHPSEYNGEDPSSENLKALKDSKLVGIGEVGLDYHFEPYNRNEQIKLFEQMIELALENDLPLVFHVRDAYDDFWPIVDNAHVKKAVVHSFSDNKSNLNQALNRDFFIGVNGLATFAPIPIPPLEKMILETDAPYLTPVPFRGKINEPSYVKNIAEWVAEKLQVSFEAVENTTTKNATTLFNL